MSCFAKLPMELCEEVVAIAAWSAHETDKRWLCALALTSRRILAIVRPALYHTVEITASNVERIISAATAAPSGHFLLTRRLCAVERNLSLHHRDVPAAFRNVDHCACCLRFMFSIFEQPSFYPTHVTARLSMCQDEGMLLGLFEYADLRATHLRLPVNSDAFFLQENPIHPTLALQHIVLESGTPRWNHARLCDIIIPFFLSGTRIQRLVITAAAHASDLPALHAELSKYARKHNERRLWVYDVPTDGRHLNHFVPGLTFDNRLWSVGRPVLAD